MEGTGTVVLTGTLEQVWSKLMDPAVLAKCIIGCDTLEHIEGNKYRAHLSIGVAAVKGKYDTQIELLEVQEQRGYKLVVHGDGPPGHVDAQGIIELAPSGDGKTTLSYSYSAMVGGKVASVGQRMLGGVAKLIMNDFFKRMKKEIENSQQSA